MTRGRLARDVDGPRSLALPWLLASAATSHFGAPGSFTDLGVPFNIRRTLSNLPPARLTPLFIGALDEPGRHESPAAMVSCRVNR